MNRRNYTVFRYEIEAFDCIDPDRNVNELVLGPDFLFHW